MFNGARRLYPGDKLGLEIEFKNFRRHKDWREVLPRLKGAIETYIARRERRLAATGWAPNHKNFKTWVNNRCWEQADEPEPTYAESTGGRCSIDGCPDAATVQDDNGRWFCHQHKHHGRFAMPPRELAELSDIDYGTEVCQHDGCSELACERVRVNDNDEMGVFCQQHSREHQLLPVCMHPSCSERSTTCQVLSNGTPVYTCEAHQHAAPAIGRDMATAQGDA